MPWNTAAWCIASCGSYAAYDFMGLFPIPLKGQRAVYLLAEPQPEGEDVPAGLDGQLSEEPMRREQGSTLDDYAVRPYRPGDSLRIVHWKLSSKLDELVVREPESDHRPDVVLLFDLYGQPERVDALLDRLAACSLQLREKGRAHRLGVGRWKRATMPESRGIGCGFCPISVAGWRTAAPRRSH